MRLTIQVANRKIIQKSKHIIKIKKNESQKNTTKLKKYHKSQKTKSKNTTTAKKCHKSQKNTTRVKKYHKSQKLPQQCHKTQKIPQNKNKIPTSNTGTAMIVTTTTLNDERT